MPISNVRGARAATEAALVLPNAYREKTPNAITLPASRAALHSTRIQILIFKSSRPWDGFAVLTAKQRAVRIP
jgi:hypothetical protein